jgi:hypothetical protein
MVTGGVGLRWRGTDRMAARGHPIDHEDGESGIRHLRDTPDFIEPEPDEGLALAMVPANRAACCSTLMTAFLIFLASSVIAPAFSPSSQSSADWRGQSSFHFRYAALLFRAGYAVASPIFIENIIQISIVHGVMGPCADIQN